MTIHTLQLHTISDQSSERMFFHENDRTQICNLLQICTILHKKEGPGPLITKRAYALRTCRTGPPGYIGWTVDTVPVPAYVHCRLAVLYGNPAEAELAY
jgi:hypothetical protein